MIVAVSPAATKAVDDQHRSHRYWDVSASAYLAEEERVLRSPLVEQLPPGPPAPPDGGPGWHVREPAQRPTYEPTPPPVEPVSAGPVFQPPLVPTPDGEPPRKRRSNLGLVLIGVVLFGLAGGGAVFLTGNHAGPSSSGGAGSASSANPSDAKAAFVASIQRTERLSFRSDISMKESFTVSGPGGTNFGALSGAGLSFTIHVDQESAQRSEVRETLAASGVNQTLIAVLYDGTAYLSTDNGAQYQTFPVNQAASHQLDPKTPLQFLEMVATVKQTGDAELNGAPVTQYHADLDPVKENAFFKAALAAQKNPLVSKLINSVGVTDGSLDASLDGAGHIVSDRGYMDAALDLGAFAPSEAGSTLNVRVSFTGWFSDYGSSISISRPGTVTGSTTLA